MRITLDDNSPSLQYVSVNDSVRWTHDILEATLGDASLNRYFKGSMTRTTGEGNYMTFTFNGTAVAIYGAKRYNHGVYSVSLDGGPPLLQSGAKTSPEEYQALLYRQDDLDRDKEHTVVITNLPSRSPPLGPGEAWYLDIDYVNIQTPPFDGDVLTTRIDDTWPECTYQGGWVDGPSSYQDRYYNTSAHFTDKINDSVTCNFTGYSVQILGGIYPEHGNYSVSIDGTDPIILNGTLYAFNGQVPLYTASSLINGPHTITMTNLEQGKFLDFDYLLVNSTIKPVTSPSPAPEGEVIDPYDSASGTSFVPVGAIVGGVVGGTLSIISLAVLAWLLWRRHKRNKAEAYAEKPSLDLTGDEVRPFRDGTTPPADGPFNDPHPSATSTSVQSPSGSTPYLSMIPPPPPSSNASYPASAPDQSREQYDSLRSLGDQAHPPSAFPTSRTSHQAPSDAGTFGQPHPQPPAPPPRVPSTSTSTKTPGIALPFTARRPSTLASSEDSSQAQTPSRRLFVNGRESDAGPIPLSPLSDESHEMGILPPDYHQATEPLPGQAPKRVA